MLRQSNIWFRKQGVPLVFLHVEMLDAFPRSVPGFVGESIMRLLYLPARYPHLHRLTN